ncbi:MAG: bifunctional adenosylcobinamide kinase/adenosylcobinamide-phosphate guanylyltransferase [Cyanobacteria bacterium P01_F01_bin.3]
MACILVTGPSRSGKSEWAEQLATRLAARQGKQVVYIATARMDPNDAEWQQRIEQHRVRRPAHWRVEEVPLKLADAIAQYTDHHCLLIDSLGTWLANLIEQDDRQWIATQAAFVEALRHTTSTVIAVAEETGWGLVPAYELGRQFRDRLGALSRAVGELSIDVYLVTGGYALNISDLGTPVLGAPVDPQKH